MNISSENFNPINHTPNIHKFVYEDIYRERRQEVSGKKS